MDPELPSPRKLALMGVVFEGGLGLVAVGVGWYFEKPPQRFIEWTLPGFGWGLLGCLPLLAFFWICLRLPRGPFVDLLDIVDNYLMPLFRHSHVYELAVISALAGLGEELLFRGVIQVSIADTLDGPAGAALGLVLAAILFGLVHFITPSYVLMAGLMGLYLGGLWLATQNLLVPITAHAVYDFLVLVYLAKIRKPPKAP
jgi:uncharacterized protein